MASDRNLEPRLCQARQFGDCDRVVGPNNERDAARLCRNQIRDWGRFTCGRHLLENLLVARAE